MVDALVQLRGVAKRFGEQIVLASVDFTIAEGEVFGYIGPNGAGKTTTLRILAGLISRFEGTVLVGGRDVVRERAATHAMIGFLPQSAAFQSWRTVRGALDSLAALSGVPAEVSGRRIPALLERFGMTAACNKSVRELSGGMTQKLGLIQALVHEPRLLVLDEPLEGLDPPSRNLLKDVIRERREAGTTVLFSSHILSDVEDIADRVGILDRGRVTTCGSIRELVAGFGLPTEIDVEFSRPPDDLTTLSVHGAAEPRGDGRWRITVRRDVDPDEAIHHIVERAIAGGARLRRIGVAEPVLDEIFAHYLEASHGD